MDIKSSYCAGPHSMEAPKRQKSYNGSIRSQKISPSPKMYRTGPFKMPVARCSAWSKNAVKYSKCVLGRAEDISENMRRLYY